MRTKSKPKNSLGTKAWDLSDLYSGINDPNIAKDKKGIEAGAKKFVQKYKGKINNRNLTTSLLLNALNDIQQIEENLLIYEYFANLLHEKDSADNKIGKFYQESREFDTKITSQTLWFELELKSLPDNIFKKLLRDRKLSSYKHYLKKVKTFSKFTLNENEEVLTEKLSQTGISAFRRLYDEVNASQVYKFNNKDLNHSQITKILSYDQNRDKRELAGKAITESLKNSQHLYTYILNTLLLNKKTQDEIRDYKFPQQQTFLSYEVDEKIVNALTTTVTNNFKICENYYETKARLLGLKKLHEWDRYSTIFPGLEYKFSWKDAEKLILESFQKFSPEFAKIAKLFFDNNWIDSEVVPNKSSGAFCSYLVPSKHPYILMNYTGQWRDVTTLAHELGHGIHAYLSRENNLYNFWPSTATAEIASIFCESVLIDALLEKVEDPKLKLNILATLIEGAFSTIFRQTVLYLFELEIHNHRRNKGELTTKEINDYYQLHLQKMFGKSLKLTERHGYYWMNISHFYSYNFYVFTYAFGESLAQTLYAQYKNQGEKFVSKYTNALSLGGSKSPNGILRSLEVNIADSGFWNRGLALVEKQVKEFQKLAKQV